MADKKLPVSVVISAVDNITYKVMAINEKLNRITAPVQKVGKAFSTLGEESGLGKLGASLSKVGSTGKELFSSIGTAAMQFAGVTAAAGGAILGITHSFGEAGDDVAMLAARFGLTTNAYQELAYAAKMANVDQETFNATMGKFSKGVGEAAAGQGEALVGFNALGLSLRGANGHLKTSDQLFTQVADKLGGIHNQSVRNAIAAKIFGREGAKLNDIFKDGAKGLEELRKQSYDVGAVMSPEDIKLASQFDDMYKSVTSTLTGLKNTIGAALAPTVITLGKNLQKYLLDHRGEIKDFATAFAAKLPGVIADLTKLFMNLGAIILPLVGIFNSLADTFGAVNLAALWFGGPVILNLFKFISAIGGTLPSALRVASIAGSFLLDALIPLGVFLAGLITWPVLLGVALVGAAVAIWKWWGPLSDFISKTWDKLKNMVGIKSDISATTTTTANSSMLGPPQGFGASVNAAAQNSSQASTAKVQIDFMNAPKGTTATTKAIDNADLDVNMGYATAGGF